MLENLLFALKAFGLLIAIVFAGCIFVVVSILFIAIVDAFKKAYQRYCEKQNKELFEQNVQKYAFSNATEIEPKEVKKRGRKKKDGTTSTLC